MLTTTQIAAILVLLQVFGVSTSTISVIEQDLVGTTTQAVAKTTPAITTQTTPMTESAPTSGPVAGAAQVSQPAAAPAAPAFTKGPEASTTPDSGTVTVTWQTDQNATAAFYIDQQRHEDWTEVQPFKTFDTATSFSVDTDKHRGVWFYAVIVTANGQSTVHTGQLPGY